MKIYTYSLIVLFMSNICAEPSIEVQRLYAAAQKNNSESIENSLKWHAQPDAKKPAKMLEQAIDMAKANNNAHVAVLLNARLKQEQMGSWERYFRGITLVATIGVLVGIGMAYKTCTNKPGNARHSSNDLDVEASPVVENDEDQLEESAVNENVSSLPVAAPVSGQSRSRVLSDEEAQRVMRRRVQSPIQEQRSKRAAEVE